MANVQGTESGARRVRMNPEERRQQILQAAVRVFYEKGYDHASTRDLSRAAETSIAGIYHHFSDKELLLFHILDGAMEKLLSLQRRAGSVEGPPRAKIEAMIAAVVTAVTENLREVTLLFKEGHRLTPAHRRIIRTKERQSFELVRQELARLQQRGEMCAVHLNTAAFSMLGMINWLFYWYDPQKPLTSAELARDISRIFLDGTLASCGADSAAAQETAAPNRIS